MNLLQEQAIAYQKLMKYEYYFVVAYKNKTRTFILRFPVNNFLHLTGIHKLTDLKVHRMSSEKIFEKCLNGSLKYNDLKRSEFFDLIESRVGLVSRIEKLLDSEHLVIICNGNFMKKYSNIPADYINEGVIDSHVCYLFLQNYDKNKKIANKQIDATTIVYPISCFRKTKQDYRQDNMISHILIKDKRPTTGSI